jgi:ribulose-phosphate 3-epimerase
MNVELGIKSDPIEYRYSFDWLFTLMERLELHHVQLGSWFEMYSLPDSYFASLRRRAADHGIAISSTFTAHRELGGLMSPDPDLQRVALGAFRRYLEISAILGAESAGTNLGAIERDQMHEKADGIARWTAAAEGLLSRARELGLAAVTIEVMSSLAEPPSTPEEIRALMSHFEQFHGANADTTVPLLLCTDVSHGLADEHGRVVHGNLELFEMAIPWTWEFHIKNTDERFGSTFGFGCEQCRSGIVDLAEVWSIVERNTGRFPRDTVVGYLEINGPKLGRDYSDPLLGAQLTESIAAIREHFGTAKGTGSP